MQIQLHSFPLKVLSELSDVNNSESRHWHGKALERTYRTSWLLMQPLGLNCPKIQRNFQTQWKCLCKLNIIFIHTFLYYLNDSASRHGKALSLGIWRDFPHLFVSVSYMYQKNRLLLHNSILRLLSSKNVKVIVTSTI